MLVLFSILLWWYTCPQVSHYLAAMVMDELIFCQLLEALMDGGKAMMLRMQAQHILNSE